MRITKENLTRYDQHFKSWHRRRLGYGKALENWHQTEEAGAVQFYPVGGSALEGKVKFSFKETPPASGDKSPSNPSTMSGVSSVKVVRAGTNLFALQPSLCYGYLHFEEKGEGKLRIYGTTQSSYDAITLFPASKVLGNVLLRGNTYTASYYGTDSNLSLQIFAKQPNNSYIHLAACSVSSNIKTFTVPEQSTNVWIRVQTDAGKTVDDTVRAQIELGSTATAFEPYAGTDYAIDLGNTYYGGEIDLATGLMTVTHVGYVLDSTTGWNATSAAYTYRTVKSNAITITSYNYGAVTPLFKCSHFELSAADTANMPNNTFYPRGDGNVIISTDNLSMQDFKNWLDAQKSAGTPVVVTYPLATPYTVQLDPLALSALAQTSRHEPRLNTVYTDADSIQITYQKSSIRAATEQEMAILGLGGNV